ncbi:hypothetical protein N473_21835 [Pseudoalteromonas luteoviolacea CPMOR-1]|uniref:Uncharacterized protein n=1 Tax=Pseudoalteromonas luteoviolacea CPMOR-1 TaxID=1365248 RepID=A0A161YKE8_9GAMM|nr:hypothetical protein [Pseudoalteromonas luteoviolacea]KZN61832.1 hypothetical protein N473_21835 [Pseudoalteromonas luteoviolacea CPMOR-1]
MTTIFNGILFAGLAYWSSKSGLLKPINTVARGKLGKNNQHSEAHNFKG